MQVNRYLKNKDMDHIDHALGRPVDPMAETYRNHFAASECEADQFTAPNWVETYRHSNLVGFRVTDVGRAALKAHLAEIGDKTRLYALTFHGEEMSPIAATSPSKAKYAKWLDWDTNDMTFKDFCQGVRVRLA
jgi:hypothetical protein